MKLRIFFIGLAGLLALATLILDVEAERAATGVPSTESFEFGPTWGSSGIVFFAGTPPLSTNPQLNLFRVNSNGDNRVQITEAAGRDWQPWFSSDGSRIYFSSDRGGNSEIYVAHGDGTNVQQVTRNGGVNRTPYPSPDGRYVAFAADLELNGNLELFVLDLQSNQLVQITDDPGMDQLPTWNPNGVHLVFVSNRNGNEDLFLVDFSSGIERFNISQLTDDEGVDTRANWFDAKHLVWETDRTGDLELFSARFDNSKLQSLTNVTQSTADEFGRPAFSPDRSQMAFTSNRNGSNQIFIMDLLLPFAEALDEDKNNQLDDDEVLMAIELWIAGDSPFRLNKPLTDEMMRQLIDLWVKGLPTDTVL